MTIWPTWLRRAGATSVLAVVLLPLGTTTASAHAAGLDPQPVLPRVVALEPAVPGLAVSVVEYGARLRIDNGTTAPVDVAPAGQARTVEPVVAPGTTGRWVDPRVTAAGRDDGPGPVVWSIPLTVGGTAVVVRGETTRPPAPSPLPWWLLTAAVAVAATILGSLAVRRRWAALVAGALSVAMAASYVVHVLGSALAPDGADYWPTVWRTAGAVGTIAVVAALAGTVLTVAGKRFGLLLCALSGALLVLLTGADAGSFANAVLPFGWAPDLDRVTTALTFGGGLGLFLTGFAVLRALTPAADEPGASGSPDPDGPAGAPGPPHAGHPAPTPSPDGSVEAAVTDRPVTSAPAADAQESR
ncbi:hypothetical protein [Pseudonocardia sp. N23]|uniref:hypothetical protein n=1 Tax=Pseudonocardia sp. N23 TaxID=1987376 RepID=UPI000BFD72D4|nr:hypothetical protein [Pseudonocardia sp. N23]GAY12451.1 hypothetical protein TOK_0847 [Pseudonocardia sp. N23]